MKNENRQCGAECLFIHTKREEQTPHVLTIHLVENRLFVDVVCSDIIFAFDIIQLLLLLIDVQSFECLIRLIVQHDQVTIANVKSGQVIARIFRIENIFVDNKCRSSCFRCISTAKSNERRKRIMFWHNRLPIRMKTQIIRMYLHSDLSYCTVFTEDIVHFIGCDFVW